ncbi:Uu.00g034530.m01.CDS01 [Anthostomella pinea]|uniref:Uu.00g034530.m01.CDS01 n=1 Tax=Anthostomella pinea TaxID=933095 RepID=A0AAI8V928_9PEZI|nr:Uu.00g034530.m01.CDS01 [Anthostomella pinea]
MHTTTIATVAAGFVGLASAGAAPNGANAEIVINAGTLNTTVLIPIGSVYTSESNLTAVSTLYLTGASPVPVESVTCTPYQSTDGTGTSGLPFTVESPSFLSTNTVQVGSILCESTESSDTSSSSPSSSLAQTFVSLTTTATPVLATTVVSGVTITTSTTPSAPKAGTNGSATAPGGGAAATATPSTTAPAGSRAMSVASAPYFMAALMFGAVSLVFSL